MRMYKNIWRRIKIFAPATYGMSQIWGGPTSEYQKKWKESFDKLVQNENEDIRKIGELGKKVANLRRLNALEKEKRGAIYGRK